MTTERVFPLNQQPTTSGMLSPTPAVKLGGQFLNTMLGLLDMAYIWHTYHKQLKRKAGLYTRQQLWHQPAKPTRSTRPL